MISDLNGSLRSRQFLNVARLANERTRLHRARAHLKVPAVLFTRLKRTSD